MARRARPSMSFVSRQALSFGQPRSARGLFFVYPGPTGPLEIWHAEKFESR